jgi:hypothetical protein
MRIVEVSRGHIEIGGSSPHLAMVTIAPIPGRQVPQNLYRVATDTPDSTPAVYQGEYKTIDAVLKAFSRPLKFSLKIAVIEALTHDRSITFSLEEAHDLEVP